MHVSVQVFLYTVYTRLIKCSYVKKVGELGAVTIWVVKALLHRRFLLRSFSFLMHATEWIDLRMFRPSVQSYINQYFCDSTTQSHASEKWEKRHKNHPCKRGLRVLPTCVYLLYYWCRLTLFSCVFVDIRTATTNNDSLLTITVKDITVIVLFYLKDIFLQTFHRISNKRLCIFLL